MTYIYPFEKLDVWQNSVELVKIIYEIIESFPPNEKYNLVSQVRRSALSISSNIAEGSSRTSGKDYAHFLQIAYGSCLELICQIRIAYELNYLNENDYLNFREQIEMITNQINSLRKFQLNK